MNILVTRLSALGDVAMMIPVLSSIAQRYPEHHFTVVSMPLVAPLFKELANVKFIPFDKRNQHKGMKGIVSLFRQLQKGEQFDHVVDLHDVLRTKFLRTLFRVSGVQVHIIDKGRNEKKALIENGYQQSTQLLSSVERYRNTFATLGLTIGSINRGLPFELKVSGNPIEAKFGAKLGKWVGIAPFTQHAGKQLSLYKIEKIIDYFYQQEDTTIFLFGAGKNEISQIENWKKKYPNVHSVAGLFPLDIEVLLMKDLNVMFSMDSGNMHLASLVGTPVVSAWGATHPYAGFYNPNQAEDDAVQVNLPCRPCSIFGNQPCKFGTYECLEKIEVNDIVIKMAKYLN